MRPGSVRVAAAAGPGRDRLLGLDQGERFDAVLARIAEGTPAALVAPPDRTLSAAPAGGGLADNGYRITGATVIAEWLTQSEDVVLLLPVAASGTWLCAVVARHDLSGRSTPVPSIDNERMVRLDLDGLR